jgi:hypothetical protein
VIVLAGRPYGHAHIGPTARWMKLPAEWVQLDTLVTTQRHVYIDALLRTAYPDDVDNPLVMPHVVEFRGVHYLEDGHTRVTLAALAGEREILARVSHLPQEEAPHA